MPKAKRPKVKAKRPSRKRRDKGSSVREAIVFAGGLRKRHATYTGSRRLFAAHQTAENASLFRSVRTLAKREGFTVQSVIEQALAGWFMRYPSKP